MPKWVYTGAAFACGPYRGKSADDVASRMDAEIRAAAKAAKIKVDEARQDLVDHLTPW